MLYIIISSAQSTLILYKARSEIYKPFLRTDINIKEYNKIETYNRPVYNRGRTGPRDAAINTKIVLSTLSFRLKYDAISRKRITFSPFCIAGKRDHLDKLFLFGKRYKSSEERYNIIFEIRDI